MPDILRLKNMLAVELHNLYIEPSDIEAFEPEPGIQTVAHILVSERHGKFDLIHLVAYLLSRSTQKALDQHTPTHVA